MLKISHKELAELIKAYYEKKIPLFVRGRFGIGKTVAVISAAEEIGKAKGREIKVWNFLSEEEKDKCFAHPENYFMIVDTRLSEYDASDIKGLPVFKDDKQASIEYRIPFWALYTTQNNSDGIIFFDELNLAPPIVQSSCYKIIHEKVINESKIFANWNIMGAGNTDEDMAHIHDMAFPLRDRMGEVELQTPNAEEWISNFAIPKKINPLIIGFMAFKTSSIWMVNPDDQQKFTTPRGWERVSKLMELWTDKKNYDLLRLLACSAIGEGVATSFVAFCKINDTIKLAEIIANPEKLKTIKDIQTKWFIISAVSEQYKDEKLKIDKVVDISKVMDGNGDAELVAYLWKMCYGFSEKRFEKEFRIMAKTNKDALGLVNKYVKYLQ
jgi:hypothetical protein